MSLIERIKKAEEFFATQWKIETTIPNGDVISTVETPPICGVSGLRTAIFSNGSSALLKTHANKSEAVSFHMQFVNHELLRTVCMVSE